jgi:hypothetical protein
VLITLHGVPELCLSVQGLVPWFLICWSPSLYSCYSSLLLSFHLSCPLSLKVLQSNVFCMQDIILLSSTWAWSLPTWSVIRAFWRFASAPYLGSLCPSDALMDVQVSWSCGVVLCNYSRASTSVFILLLIPWCPFQLLSWWTWHWEQRSL